jgi:hypothetical protein
MKSLFTILALVLSCACSDRNDSPPPQSFDASRARRVFRPPPGEVRPVPPHAIHNEGVGPYVLGTPLKSVLYQVPHGPRVVLSQIDGVVDYSLVRTERDAVIIGVEQPTGVAFVSVLDSKIARTETGVGVGTSVAELRQAMGAAIAAPDVVMDPHIEGFERLPNVRFVLDRTGAKGKVSAVVVRRDSLLALDPSSDGGVAQTSPSLCNSAENLARREAAVIAAARLPAEKSAPRVVYSCVSGVPDALVSHGERVVLIGGEPGKLRRLASYSATDMVYAAPLDTDADGRHEIAVVTKDADGDDQRTWSVEILRFEAGRLQRVIAEDLYRVSAQSASWVGASIEEIELLIELAMVGESLRASGFYMHHGDAGVDTAAPLLGASVTIRRKRPGLPAASQSPSDGGVGHDRRDAGRADSTPLPGGPAVESDAMPARP